MAEVILESVKKKYDGVEEYTIKDTNLHIKDKEFMIFVGPSGCGKSTTLRMIAGLEDITEGTIKIGDRVVNDVPPKERDIAMVFQNYALYPHMNVYENLAFALKLRKTPVEEINEKVRAASKILGIDPLLERLPKQLSGGQRQRVALGRAIVRNPKVFLMDEPLSNLDAKLRVQMRSELIRLHHSLNTTIIYVTHDQVEAMTMGDRICIYYDGYVQQCDTPQEVYNAPANLFVAGFIGSPSMNFFDVVYDQGKLIYKDSFSLAVPENKKALLAAYQGKPLVLGFRPEHINLVGCYNGEVKEGSKIKAVVDVVEHMGNEIFLTAKIGEIALMARVPAEAQVTFNQAVELIVELDKIHIFDKNTEKAIR